MSILIEKETIPVNNGSGFFTKTINDNTIDVEYEFEAISRTHYFTISNNGHTTRKARGTTGGILNKDGWNICDLFVVLHSPLMCGCEGYADELVAGSIEFYIMNKEGTQFWFDLMNKIITTNMTADEINKYIENAMS